MELIEQAVFSSAETVRAAGYQVVAASPGIGDADLRELATWGPSHDALVDPSPHAASLNFHPLPSGTFCVSRTVPAGSEYSARGGPRIYTQCLVVPPRVLRRFANNPFALWRAATAAGFVRLYQTVPARLEAFRLSGKAATLDTALLDRLLSELTPEWIATLVQAALHQQRVAVVGGAPAEQVIAGLLNCFPPSWRTRLWFSTGLKPCSLRPFRICALGQDPQEQRRAQRATGALVLNLAHAPPPQLAPTDPWARLIHRVLENRQMSVFAEQLAQAEPVETPEQLWRLASVLMEQIDGAPPAPRPRLRVVHPEEPDIPGQDRVAQPSRPPSPARPMLEAHQPQVRFDYPRQVSARARPGGPSATLDRSDPVLLEKLERLDDLVYDAIAGRPGALEQLTQYWPKVHEELGEPLLAESREQYVRHALHIWQSCLTPEGISDPARTLCVLDVLCLLFDGL